MATSVATIAVNYDKTMYLTLASNDPTGTVTAVGTEVSLLPQSADENQFHLTFQPGSGVSSVIGISVTSVSSFSVSIQAGASGGIATAICTYRSFQSPAPVATFNLSYRTSSGENLLHDPTITFNPPSGVGVIEIEEAPVAAEEVLV